MDGQRGEEKRENDEKDEHARRHGGSALGQSESQTSVASTIFVAGGGESQRRDLTPAKRGDVPAKTDRGLAFLAQSQAQIAPSGQSDFDVGLKFRAGGTCQIIQDTLRPALLRPTSPS